MKKVEKNKVSMQNIADELGVSKVTISKALNKKEGVSDELRKKIIAVANKYNYVLPDAHNTKNLKFAIIMNNKFNTGHGDTGKFYLRMYEAIIRELQKYNYTGIMFTPNINTINTDLKLIESQGEFDGIIMLGILSREVKEKLENSDLPKVYVDVYDETHSTDSFVTENFYSSYEITDLLIEENHRDIGFVGTVGSTTSITDRYLGYARRLIEEGIKPRDDWRIPDRDETGKAISLALPEELPTAFVCNCDETAFELVRTLKQRGIKVPDDISVVGFDDSIYAKICEPPLTTVAVDIEKIGKLAVKGMVKRIKKPEKKGGEVVRIPGRIIVRDSIKSRSNRKED